jgi:hypothetical protein
MKPEAHAGGNKKKLTEGQCMAAKRRGGKNSRKKRGGTGIEFVSVRYSRTIEGDEFGKYTFEYRFERVVFPRGFGESQPRRIREGHLQHEQHRERLGCAEARRLRRLSPSQREASGAVFAFRLNEGNVKRHSIERLNSLVDAVAGKRITLKQVTA